MLLSITTYSTQVKDHSCFFPQLFNTFWLNVGREVATPWRPFPTQAAPAAHKLQVGSRANQAFFFSYRLLQATWPCMYIIDGTIHVEYFTPATSAEKPQVASQSFSGRERTI